jgi:hypothetical protein
VAYVVVAAITASIEFISLITSLLDVGSDKIELAVGLFIIEKKLELGNTIALTNKILEMDAVSRPVKGPKIITARVL